MLVSKIFTLPFAITSVAKSNLYSVSNDNASAEGLKENTADEVAVITNGVEDNTVHFQMPQLVGEVDEDALLKASTFPISPLDLIAKTKEILNPGIKLGQEDGGECLADDFEFVAAVVGPIGKEEYINALAGFQLEQSFDITPNFFGFSVDPIQTNRVWFFSRQQATQTQTFMGAEPTDKELILPVQTHHIDFTADGKVKEFGFYTTDRRSGNTGGLGGAFGYFYGVGKPLPIPECQPYKPSRRFRLLTLIGSIGRKFKKSD